MGDMSFCLLTTFYPPAGFGGDALHVHRLATGLARRGHRVRVVHNSAAHDLLSGPPLEVSDNGSSDGVEVVAWPCGKAGTIATYLTGGPLGYGGDLRSLVEGFDVVHFHNPSLLGGPRAFSFGSGLKVYTTHEHWLLCPTHTLYRYRKEVCTSHTCWRCTTVYRRPPQLWRSTPLMERSLGSLDLILSPSEFTARMHRDLLPNATVEVLPLPGPDPEAADAASDRYRHPRPYFLYAGRLEPIKGVDTLITAFADLTGADLLIAGTGSEESRLRALAAGAPDIHFLGQRSYAQVLSLCRDARAVILPSVGYETFGGAAVDAMTMGTPAVVRDLGPLPELISDGGGYIFSDEASLVRILQKLVDDPTEARVVGIRAQEVARRWSEERFFVRYLGLIAAAAGGSDRR